MGVKGGGEVDMMSKEGWSWWCIFGAFGVHEGARR